MPGSPTPILGLTVPAVGGDSRIWGGELNGDFAILDSLGAAPIFSGRNGWDESALVDERGRKPEATNMIDYSGSHMKGTLSFVMDKLFEETWDGLTH